MISRTRRQERITGLIAGRHVRSQEQLRALLADEGIETTQATLSRDLREIGVWKGPAGYELPDAAAAAMAGDDLDGDRDRALERTLERELVAAERSGSIVVLRTAPGHANALALEIDRARLEGIVGTLAGDDTVFVATPSAGTARTVLDEVRVLAKH